MDYLRVERRLAPLTCSAYERDVGACIAFLEREGIDTLGEVRPGELRRFLAEESVRRPAPSSQSRAVAALKGFFRFLLENEEIDRREREKADAKWNDDRDALAREYFAHTQIQVSGCGESRGNKFSH